MSTELRAFELRPEYNLEELNGATVAYGASAQMLDVKSALVDGSGRIVSGDPSVISVLAGFPILQPASLEADDEPTPVSVDTEMLPGSAPVSYIPQEPVTPREFTKTTPLDLPDEPAPEDKQPDAVPPTDPALPEWAAPADTPQAPVEAPADTAPDTPPATPNQ
jgi:hypothetical protein